MPRPLFPITMIGTLDECVLLSYRVPVRRVEHLVPGGLSLVALESRGERWAFWNVVLCHVSKMRPAGLPAVVGVSYHHVAYRLIVSAATAGGLVSGLFFVRSDADRALIRGPGNLLSDFHFNRANVDVRRELGRLTATVKSRDGLADAGLVLRDRDASPDALAPGSPFGTVEQARAFLKYQPLGVCPNDAGTLVRLAEVERDESLWREEPAHIVEASFPYLDNLSAGEARLELASRVAPIAYRWRLGRTLRLRGDRK